MSQQITCLIIPKIFEIDKGIVHFKIKGFTFIPIDYYINDFNKNAKGFESLSDYFQYLRADDNFIELKGFNDEEGLESYLVKLIEEYAIDTFILEQYYEWEHVPFDLYFKVKNLKPFDYYFMYIKGGKIISKSLVFNEEKPSNKNLTNVEKYKKELGLDFDWLQIKEIFYSYDIAQKKYLLH